MQVSDWESPELGLHTTVGTLAIRVRYCDCRVLPCVHGREGFQIQELGWVNPGVLANDRRWGQKRAHMQVGAHRVVEAGAWYQLAA